MKLYQILRLDEAATDRYFQMYQALKPLIAVRAQQGQQDRISPLIMSDIQTAKNLFKKDDRVIWYLRYARMEMISDFLETLENGDPIKQSLQAAYERDLKTMASKTTNGNLHELQSDIAFVNSSNFRVTMRHYLSLQIPEIHNMPFTWQRPLQITNAMSEIEGEWASSQNGNVPPTEEGDYDEPEKLIDFGDGFAWWDLRQAYCSAEAKAMGHCGNAPRSKTEDHILTLRKRIEKNGKQYDVPFLTFILDPRGFLTEMKGRGNQKPAQRYHKYIVGLLELPVEKTGIEGIKGGGYLPEHNFDIEDLDPKVREKLLAKRPELAEIASSLSRYYQDKKKYGADSKQALTALEYAAKEAKVLPPAGLDLIPRKPSEDNAERKYDILVDSWSSPEDFANDLRFDPLTNAIEVLTGSFENDDIADKIASRLKPTEEDYWEVIHALSDHSLKKIMKDLGLTGNDRARVEREVVANINSSRYIDLINKAMAMSAVIKKPDIKDIMAYINEIIYAMDLGGIGGWLSINFDETNPLGPVTATYPLDEFESLVEYSMEKEDNPDLDDNGTGMDTLWFNITNYNGEGWLAYDGWQAESNIAERKNPKWNPEEAEIFKKFEAIEQALDGDQPITDLEFSPRAAAKAFQELLDLHESEELDPDILRIKRRAGIM